MPFKSESQRRFMFSQHPEIAQKWASEGDAMKAKPTNKSLQQLQGQEKNLENAAVKYKGSPKLIQAEQKTEQQIKSKGGKPNPKEAAILRRMKKNNGNNKHA